MTQSPTIALSPGVEFSVTSNGRTVTATTGYVFDVLALEGINHLRTIITPEKEFKISNTCKCPYFIIRFPYT